MELQPVETPGDGNRCLYHAVLIAAGLPASASASLALKAKAHDLIAAKLESATTSGLVRSDLRAALKLTAPGQRMATDDVIPALATLMGKTIVVHEEGLVTEVEGYSRSNAGWIHIGYVEGHFYGIEEVSV